jgi:hypothetical protein
MTLYQIDERFVWWLWQTRQFDTVRARACGYDVVFPGWFSSAAGPDFREAIIVNNGSLQRGDVEVHVRSSAWYEHGHHTNPEYNDVILHVVLFIDSSLPVMTSDGGEVPVFELGPLLLVSLEQLLLTFDHRQPSLIACPAQGFASNRVQDIVEESGTRRFQDKVMGLMSTAEVIGADEALYRTLAESLGYSQNRTAFRRLAESIPFDLLRSLELSTAENLLLAAAGLAAGKFLHPYLAEPLLQNGELVTFRVRPGNAPATRLRGLARLVYRHRTGLATAISSYQPEQLWELFVVEADHTLVGRGRANDIVINVALPYLTAYHGLDGVTMLTRCPAPPDNRWTRALRTELRARGATLHPYKAIHQQGLLELALRYCRYGSCDACPLHCPVMQHPVR